MIVDDESLVRVGLQTVIDWQEYDYEIVGSYINGLEAWAAIEQQCPDVLLTDIQMPGMDGLELIAKVKEKYKNVSIIILSSYEDFKYTRKAIQMEVKDYILKHKFESNELLDILTSLTSSSNSQKPESYSSLEVEKKQLLEDTSHFEMEDESTLFQSSYSEISTIINISEPCAAWVALKPKFDSEASVKYETKALSILVGEVMNRWNNVVYLGKEIDVYHSLIFFEGDDKEYYRKYVDQISNEVKHALKNQLNVLLTIGVSELLQCGYNAGKLRSQAETGLRQYFYEGTGIYIYSLPAYFHKFNEGEWIELQKEFKNVLWREDFNKVLDWLNQLKGKLTVKRIDTDDIIRLSRMITNYLVDLSMERYQFDLLSPESPCHNQMRAVLSLHNIDTFERLFVTLQSMIVTVHETLDGIKERRGWVNIVIEYIDQHYDQPIQLQQMADKVNFSVNYFSLKFHKQTGYMFSDYLTKVRISKAIELFTLTNKSAEEISIEVGYPNPNYFTKVFKKITGLTVTEFKKKWHIS
jgi:two-component system response regulator YesN